ncbi:rhodanese-like domain-containing protein [Nonomuraea turkmeniaca]|uniref:Rhodanese-like domain-containing protein n=2 Tax=Nonomuraea turkmeniaca TaxID=103838 RepID=A0A5S4FVC7_9ACTN|nr:rhodanese-like domain-containing protein [Nonomuraea turkmeniaca]
MTATGADVLLLDVRTPAEFETAHVDGAVNVPLDRLQAHLPQLTESAPGQVVLVCQSGARAGTAQAMLSGSGVSTSVVMTGGMNAWLAAGAPVVRGRQRWSLERQVRLVAGLLVLVSVLLSILTPWSLLVTAFVGAGLTYAGASDNCMMGLLLARLPYNRAAATDPAAALAQSCQR